MTDKKGKFYCVFGMSGSGKSTLVRYLLEKNDNVEYFRTTTTRKPRPEELSAGSLEYEFVTLVEYAQRMSATPNWNHNEVFGNYYGSDLGRLNEGLAQGKSFVSILKLEKARLERLKYQERPYEVVTILINTKPEISIPRLTHERPFHERSRLIEEVEPNLEEIHNLFDHIIYPTGEIKIDCENFLNLFI